MTTLPELYHTLPRCLEKLTEQELSHIYQKETDNNKIFYNMYIRRKNETVPPLFQLVSLIPPKCGKVEKLSIREVS